MVERNFITPEIRADLDRINQDCIRMHVPPPPALFVRCEVSDIETGEVEFVQEEKGNSFVRNYYNYIMNASGFFLDSASMGAGYTALKQTDGNAWNVGASDGFMRWYGWGRVAGMADQPAQGIAIGTDDTAWSFEQFAMGAQVGHGTGAGQMSYQVGTVANVSYNAGTKKYTQVISRPFANTSGGEISVKEVGWHHQAYVTSTLYYVLLDRTVLASPVAVANNKKITVTYTLEMTFPA